MSFKCVTVAYGRNINIQQPIAVNIGHGYPGIPVGSTRNACFYRYIFKLKIALIQV